MHTRGLLHDRISKRGTATLPKLIAITVLSQKGFLQAYQEGKDDEALEEKAASEKDTILPPLEVGQRTAVVEMAAKSHVTQPPARYTEASLVKALEERGIGRPSTYASIISVIIDRGYVIRRGTALVPQWIAFPVTRLLAERFSNLVDYDFTAQLEEDLDRIARGEVKRGEWLNSFYFGRGDSQGLKDVAIAATEEIDARALNTLEISPTINLRVGRIPMVAVELNKPAIAPCSKGVTLSEAPDAEPVRVSPNP
mgnify:CR=1 FL=1